jgi:hypothetical protein
MEEHGWSPNDRQSPYYVWGMMTDGEWLVVSQRYPFSVRVLVELRDETRWSEHGRTQTVEQAQALLHGLARLHRDKPWWVGWIVTESTCLGQQVWEKPVLWHPSQEHILEALRRGGLLPEALSESPQRRKS